KESGRLLADRVHLPSRNLQMVGRLRGVRGQVGGERFQRDLEALITVLDANHARHRDQDITYPGRAVDDRLEVIELRDQRLEIQRRSARRSNTLRSRRGDAEQRREQQKARGAAPHSATAISDAGPAGSIASIISSRS